MKIENHVLVEIDNNDLQNDELVIPEGVLRIEWNKETERYLESATEWMNDYIRKVKSDDYCSIAEREFFEKHQG